MNNKYRKYYQQIASVYDSLRLDRHEEIKNTTNIVGKFAKPNSGYLLDLGCGTARYTADFENLGFQVIGLDISFRQLLHSPQYIKKICGSAVFPPFANNSFTCCTAILLLQQLSHIERSIFYKEIMRVLKPNGFFIIKTRSHEAIKEGRTVKYFPSSLKINQKRYPTVSQILDGLESAGFKNIEIVETETVTEMKTSDYLLRVKNKHNSTLALIPEKEFTIGYQNLELALLNTESVNLPIRHTFVIVQS